MADAEEYERYKDMPARFMDCWEIDADSEERSGSFGKVRGCFPKLDAERWERSEEMRKRKRRIEDLKYAEVKLVAKNYSWEKFYAFAHDSKDGQELLLAAKRVEIEIELARELQVHGRADSSHLVEVVDVSDEGERPYMVMVKGTPLLYRPPGASADDPASSWLQVVNHDVPTSSGDPDGLMRASGGHGAPALVLYRALYLCQALLGAARGLQQAARIKYPDPFAHRDICPPNIITEWSTDHGVPWLNGYTADFGVAAVIKGTRTLTIAQEKDIGHDDYLSPQRRGHAGEGFSAEQAGYEKGTIEDDVWAFGVTIIRLWRHSDNRYRDEQNHPPSMDEAFPLPMPSHADPFAAPAGFEKWINDRIEPLPAPLRAVCAACLMTEREDRITLDDLVIALQVITDSSTTPDLRTDRRIIPEGDHGGFPEGLTNAQAALQRLTGRGAYAKKDHERAAVLQQAGDSSMLTAVLSLATSTPFGHETLPQQIDHQHVLHTLASIVGEPDETFKQGMKTYTDADRVDALVALVARPETQRLLRVANPGEEDLS